MRVLIIALAWIQTKFLNIPPLCQGFVMWVRAVWRERNKEEEGVIPKSWVLDDMVYWPPGIDALKAMKEMRKPEEKWRKFPLIKLKLTSSKSMSFAVIRTCL